MGGTGDDGVAAPDGDRRPTGGGAPPVHGDEPPPPPPGYTTMPTPELVKGGPEFPDILQMALDGSSLADAVTVQYDAASPRSRDTAPTRRRVDDEGEKRRRRRRR